MVKKRLGQHFLTAPYYARRIAGAIPAGERERVLEIGPGTGALTVHLLERFPDLHLVEIDRGLVGALKEKLGLRGYTVHECDILKFDYSRAGFPLHVAGNLPYNIGAMIIKKTLLYGPSVRSFTFMVQREVAERITAAAKTAHNGFLSVFCQYFGAPRLLFHVPPGAFFPPPSVESSVVQILPDAGRCARLSEERRNVFFAFVSRGFSMRRKMLANVLGRDGGKARYSDILSRMGLDVRARAEELDVNQWLELYEESCITEGS
jgi:16S rRNA (adenine1518-N6/adenine1519-N6)-dimethyltransferase